MPKEFIQKYNIPLFTSLSEEELDHVAESLEPISYEPNSTIIKEGEEGDCLFMIKSGKAKVVANLPDANDEIILSHLEVGDYFGEMALITGEPRSASVIAETETELWKLSKKDFDNLIQQHPDITISLTHMLSQRLKDANKARKQAEQYYKNRFIPQGTIQDIDVISLLKYVEENSLTGRLQLTHNDQVARFVFNKGQLENLDYADKNEIDAMDEILEWKEGEFIIEPEIFSPGKTNGLVEIMESVEKTDVDKVEEATTSEEGQVQESEISTEGTEVEAQVSGDGETETLEAQDQEDIDADIATEELFTLYFSEKIREFNQFAGLQVTKNALRQSYHKFENFFDVMQDIKIESSPEIEISIPNECWSEKHTLFSAVLLRDLVHSIEREVVGIEFWMPDSSSQSINAKLKDISFFDYYDQAMDFVRI